MTEHSPRMVIYGNTPSDVSEKAEAVIPALSAEPLVLDSGRCVRMDVVSQELTLAPDRTRSEVGQNRWTYILIWAALISSA